MKTLSFVLIAVIAVSSTLSGLLLISDPDGSILNLPLSLLENTPFKNYFLPGILLVVVVSSINLTALYTSIARSKSHNNWSIAAGLVTMGWIIAQMVFMKAVHWLHFFYLGAGLLIILIAYQSKGKWAA